MMGRRVNGEGERVRGGGERGRGQARGTQTKGSKREKMTGRKKRKGGEPSAEGTPKRQLIATKLSVRSPTRLRAAGQSSPVLASAAHYSPSGSWRDVE